MTVSVNEFENIKKGALYGEEESTAPSSAKFSTTENTKKILEDFDREKRLSKKALGTRYIYWKCIRNFFFYLAFLLLLSQPIQFGIAYAYLRASRGEKLEIKDMFAFFRNYWNVVLAAFLCNLIIVVGILFLIVPGIILACKLAFVPYLVMDKKIEAIDAIKESWSLTDGYAWKIFLMVLLVFPIIIGGLLCLLFGVIISFIWINLAFASMYHAVRLKKG